jgi:uncharacterized protein (DUF1778 family)
VKIILDNESPCAYSQPMFKAPKAASRKAPSRGVRFRTRAELAEVTRAANILGITFNTFVADTMAKTAKQVIAAEASGGVREPDLQATA